MATIQRHRITVEQIGLKYGLILAGANIGFFLLMAIFGLEDNITLRFVNLVFIFFVSYKGLQYFKHHSLKHWTYLKGLGLGVYIVLVGAIVFSIFLAIFGFLDANFVPSINAKKPMGLTVNPVMLAAFAFFETAFYGFILVFAAMQRLKTTHMQDSVHI